MPIFNLDEANSAKGKVAIVTGANSGIGFEIAKILSDRGATVILACRNMNEGIKTQNKIKGKSLYMNLDLADFQSIRNFCKLLKAKSDGVDILINNGGVMFPPLTRTIDGLELTFGVNYIGAFLLTNTLMPMLQNVEKSRVVNMSSIAQYRVKDIDWKNINSEIYYSKVKSYGLSNLFRAMFTLELEKRLRLKNFETISVSCHPGVTFTNLYRTIPKIIRNHFLAAIINKTIFHTPYKGAMPAIMAATSPNIMGGEFVGLDTKNQFRGNPTVVEPNGLAMDTDLREKLWQKSVEITGVDLQ